jgi:hypothetical protein
MLAAAMEGLGLLELSEHVLPRVGAEDALADPKQPQPASAGQEIPSVAPDDLTGVDTDESNADDGEQITDQDTDGNDEDEPDEEEPDDSDDSDSAPALEPSGSWKPDPEQYGMAGGAEVVVGVERDADVVSTSSVMRPSRRVAGSARGTPPGGCSGHETGRGAGRRRAGGTSSGNACSARLRAPWIHQTSPY